MRVFENAKSWKPYGLYILLALIAFFPCLILGKAYYTNDLIYQFGPFRQFLKDQLLQGHFPLWNPYIFGGQPFFANPNSMMCYLPTYLTLFFPTGYGLSLFFFIHMAIAGAGMHWWLKSLRLSDHAIRIGAAAYALSGFFWFELIHLHILADYALFPVLMACIEKLRHNWAPRWAFAAGLTFAVIFDCGSFQSTSWILYTALAYVLFGLLTHKRTATPEAAQSASAWKKLFLIGLFAFWGALPLFVHLIPAKEFSDLSNRKPQGQTYENFQGTFSMKPSTLYQFLFPTLTLPQGATIETAIQVVNDQQNITNDYIANFGYLGIWVPFLFVFAFLRKEKKFLYFISAFSLFSIFVAFGRFFPLHKLLCDYLPLINLSRAPFRFVEGYLLFGCVLLAYGFQTLERRLDEPKKAHGIVLAAAGYAILLLIVCFSRPDQTWREILGLGLGMIGLGLWGLTQSWKKIGLCTLMTALVLPLLLTGWNDYQPAAASNYNIEDNFPSFIHLHKADPLNRYYFDNSLQYPISKDDHFAAIPFPENLAIAEQVRDLGGYSPIVLIPLVELHQLPSQRQMQLFAANGLLFGKSEGDQPGYTHEDLESAQLYTQNAPSPYVNAPNNVVIAPDHFTMIKMLGLPNFNPANDIIFNEPISAPMSTQLPREKAQMNYELKAETTDSQSFNVSLDRNSWVTFSEMVYPGWKAFVDGEPVDMYTANDAFRALFIHTGSHLVEFKYQPAWFFPLIALLSIWILSALFYVVWLYASKEPKAIE